MWRKQQSWFHVFLTQERPVWSLWVCQEFKRKKQRQERKYRKSSLRMKSTRSMWKRRKRCRVSKRRRKKEIVHVVLLCSQCLVCNVMTSVCYTADGDGFPHFHTVPNTAGYSYTVFGARGCAVVWCTALQAGRSRVTPMNTSSWTAWPWSWDRHVVPKRRFLPVYAA